MSKLAQLVLLGFHELFHDFVGFVKARVASVALTEKSQPTQAVQSVSVVVSAVVSAVASAAESKLVRTG